MIVVNIKQSFSCSIEKLWHIVTDQQNYAWRSDVAKIEVLDQDHFIEYTKSHYPTYFTITCKKAEQKYQFTLENSHMKGTWTGLFNELEEGKVELDFTEEIEVKSWLLKLFAKAYLRKMQRNYMRDLEVEVEK